LFSRSLRPETLPRSQSLSPSTLAQPSILKQTICEAHCYV
jgi:hypothetical protein